MQQHRRGDFCPIAIKWPNGFRKPAQFATSTTTKLDPPTVDESRRPSAQRPMVRPSARWPRGAVNGDMNLIDTVQLLSEISRQKAREPWRQCSANDERTVGVSK